MGLLFIACGAGASRPSDEDGLPEPEDAAAASGGGGGGGGSAGSGGRGGETVTIPGRDAAQDQSSVERDAGRTPDAGAGDMAASADSGAADARRADGAVPGDGAANNRPVAIDDLEARSFASPTTKLKLPYRLFVPRGYDPARKYGVLLFLHGAGERGSDNVAQVREANALAWVQPAAQAGHETIVIYPQCPSGAQWVDTDWTKGSYSADKVPLSKPLATALEILADVRAKYTVDPARVLITGLSMGGYGTWDALVRNPSLFAAAIAVCGAGDPTKAPLIKAMPLWAFHGDKDPTVPVSGSREMIAALKAAGGMPKYTEIPGLGHNAWDVAYKDATAISWLLEKQKP